MSYKETIIEKIRQAFSENDYPRDDYLQASVEGCEPYEEVSPFRASATGGSSSRIS